MKGIEKLFDKIEKTETNIYSRRWELVKSKLKKVFSSSVHVICLNDSVDSVVIGSESRAKRKCAAIKKAYIKKHFYWMRGKELEEKERLLYFHLHTVNVFFIN